MGVVETDDVSVADVPVAGIPVAGVVGAELPVTEAAEAHRLLESSEVTGKVLLRVAD